MISKCHAVYEDRECWPRLRGCPVPIFAACSGSTPTPESDCLTLPHIITTLHNQTHVLSETYQKCT